MKYVRHVFPSPKSCAIKEKVLMQVVTFFYFMKKPKTFAIKCDRNSCQVKWMKAYSFYDFLIAVTCFVFCWGVFCPKRSTGVCNSDSWSFYIKYFITIVNHIPGISSNAHKLYVYYTSSFILLPTKGFSFYGFSEYN